MKIGDRIKLVRLDEEDKSLKIKLNNIGVVIDINKLHSDFKKYWVTVKWNDNSFSNIYIKNIELVEENNMKKEDLKDYDIVTLRNGDKLILVNKGFRDLYGSNDNLVSSLNSLDNDLKYKNSTGKYDIAKVERFNSLDTNVVYTRETKKDITMEEIIKDYEDRNKCKVNVTKS